MAGVIESNGDVATLKYTLGNSQFEVTRKMVLVSDLKLDPKNPRLGYLLRHQGKGLPATDQELHKLLWDIDAVHDLHGSIFQNGGLIEDPIVNSNLVVVEGNCRTVALRELRKKYPGDERFTRLYVRQLPADLTEEQLMLLLGELHIAGRIAWRAFDQAEYVWKMNKVFGKTHDYLATLLRWSRTTLAQKIGAFEETNDYIERTGDPQGINRFSHFEEFMKKQPLRERRDNTPDFMIQFGEWVLSGKLPDAKDVRDLPAVLNNDQAYQVFLKEGIRNAKKVLEQADPSIGSNLYATLDQATAELKSISLMEITALRDGDEPRLSKFRELAKALRSLEQISGIQLG